MNICLVINSKVVLQTMVFLNSLFQNNKENEFNIYILNSSLSREEKKMILSIIPENSSMTFIDVDSKLFSNAPILWNTHSKEAYYKLLIPDVLPKDIDRVLYFDIDIVVNGSIENLYNIDFSKNYLVACTDYFVNKNMKNYKKRLGMTKKDKYFNSGVVLFNLNELRKNYKLKMAEDYIEQNHENFKYHDQEVLNALFFKKTLIIDDKYNSICKYKGIFDYVFYNIFKSGKKDIVIHYAGQKPWKGNYVGKHFDLFIKYSKPFQKELKMDILLKNRRKNKLYLVAKTLKNVLLP